MPVASATLAHTNTSDGNSILIYLTSFSAICQSDLVKACHTYGLVVGCDNPEFVNQSKLEAGDERALLALSAISLMGKVCVITG